VFDGVPVTTYIPGGDQAEIDALMKGEQLGTLVGSALVAGGAAAWAWLTGPTLAIIGAGLPPAVQSAVPKLADLATKFQTTSPALLRNVLQNGTRFADTLNKSNINVFLQRPDSTGFIRVTLDPTGQRVISSGLNQARDVASGIASGRFVPFP